jgi:hypothetical protein
MKHLIYIIIFLLSIQTNGQNSTEKRKYRIDLLTVEKTSKDTIISAIIETYSGGKRIQTAVSNFDGISIFYIDSKNVVDNRIRLKIYGPKCRIFEEEYNLKTDLNIKINLDYGETEYTHYTQMSKMLEKLKIVFEIGEE